MIYCKECGVGFDYTYHGGNRKVYCSPKCRSAAGHKRAMVTPKSKLSLLLGGARFRSKKKDVPYDIDIDFLMDLWAETDGCCCLTGRKFILKPIGSDERCNADGPSLDRIVPALGYTRGNVRLITHLMNQALSDFGIEAFESTIKAYKKYQGGNECQPNTI